jgi:competence protein ComEC
VAGLTHITAVSGANVAIAAGSVLWVSTALGARRQARLVLAAAMVAAFVVVARPQPSVLRAAVMGGLGLAGLVVARRPRGPAVLSASVVVLLAVDPWLSRSAGFALSCTATGALLLLAPVWARQWARRLPAPLAAALAVPAAAQAACGPLVILLQPTVSVVAVPANLLAEPAVAPATVAGVLAALLGVVWPAAAHVAAWCGSLATGWVALVAHRAAQAPGAALPWPAGVPGALLLAVLTAGLIALSVWPARRPGPQPDRLAARGGARGGGRRGGGRRGPVGRGRGGRAALVAAAVLVAVLVGWVLGPRVPLPGRGAQWPPAGWLVVQCDVGQGDAMVLRSGRDRAVLVDAGPLPGPIDACLRRLGVRHLDLVLLTHDHADHVLGLPGALHGRPVPELVVSPLDEPVENSRLVRQWAAAAGAAVVVGGAGLAGAAGQLPWQVRWQVLAADVPATVARPASVGARDRGPEGADGTRVNESSLVSAWQVSGPGGVIRVIGLGDLEVEGQQRLAARLTDGEVGLGGPVDVVKVAHHGSAKQDPNLYRLLAPRVAVIGVGAGNDYGHPAPSALALLREQGPAVFRTDRSGDIAVQPDADGALGVAAGGS